MLFLHLLRLFSLINQLLLASLCDYTIDNLPQYNVKESITLPFYIIKQGSQVSRKFMAELIILDRNLSDNKIWFLVFYTTDNFQGLPWCLSGKEITCNEEATGWSLSWEDPPEEEMATHSRSFARIIPWTEEPGRLQSTGSQRAGHDWVTKQQQVIC